MNGQIVLMFWWDSNSSEDLTAVGRTGLPCFPSRFYLERTKASATSPFAYQAPRHLLDILGGDLPLCTSLFFGFFFFKSKCCNFPCSYPYRLGKAPVWEVAFAARSQLCFCCCSFISETSGFYFFAFPSFQGPYQLCPINQDVSLHYPYDKNKSKGLSLHIVFHWLSPCRTRDSTLI